MDLANKDSAIWSTGQTRAAVLFTLRLVVRQQDRALLMTWQRHRFVMQRRSQYLPMRRHSRGPSTRMDQNQQIYLSHAAAEVLAF